MINSLIIETIEFPTKNITDKNIKLPETAIVASPKVSGFLYFLFSSAKVVLYGPKRIKYLLNSVS